MDVPHHPDRGWVVRGSGSVELHGFFDVPHYPDPFLSAVRVVWNYMVFSMLHTTRTAGVFFQARVEGLRAALGRPREVPGQLCGASELWDSPKL